MKTIRVYNNNPEYGECGPWCVEADDLDAALDILEEDMAPTLLDWAREESRDPDSTPDNIDDWISERVRQMRAEFRRGLTEIRHSPRTRRRCRRRGGTVMRYRIYTSYAFEYRETREQAEQTAIALARVMATDDGLDPDTVAIYDLRSRGGDWGACPEGDEGGYYPKIEEVKP